MQVITKATLDMIDKLRIKGTKDDEAIFHWKVSNSMRQTLSRYVPKEYELDFRTHNLRKTKLTKLLKEDGHNLPFVAKYARHLEIKNTMKYVEYDEHETITTLMAQQRKEMNDNEVLYKRNRKANNKMPYSR